MTKFYNSFKILLKNFLPQYVLNLIKKYHYQRVFKRFEEIEEPELKVVKKIINKGDVVIDVGANIGLFSKYLSKYAGSNGRVISIEPIPITYRFLCNNIQKNGISNVKTLNIAISNITGTLKMEVPKVIAGENYFRARITSKPVGKVFSVQTNRLDNLIGDEVFVSFIKIDVEGHELQVLKSAIGLIKKDMPNLLIEISNDIGDKNSDAYELYNLLIGLGYSCWVLKSNKLEEWQESERNINYFFLKENSIALLQKQNLIND